MKKNLYYNRIWDYKQLFISKEMKQNTKSNLN